MSWFRQNKFLGSFLVALALATALAVFFLLREKGVAEEEEARFDRTVSEFNRLRASKPFPNTANLQKGREQKDNYRNSLGELKTELKARTLPLVPLQPNEFQAQLRQAVNAVIADAASSKVKLPANFYLGFDEYATSLPNSVAAPLLGQELQAVSLLASSIVNAHVDELKSFVRTPLAEEKAAAATTPTPGRGVRPATTATVPALVSARGVEIAFSATPAVARKFLNQVATAKEQLFIIRKLNVNNQVDKGPPRGSPTDAATPTPTPVKAAGKRGAAPPGITFIVGGEHLDVVAKVDIVTLNPEKETR